MVWKLPLSHLLPESLWLLEVPGVAMILTIQDPLQEQGMRCPHLKETTVKYCRVSAFKKMIAQTPGQAVYEKCSSEDYAGCPVARQHGTTMATESRCPFLQESQARYCSVAPVTKFVPCSSAGLSRCGSEGYQACGLYLAHRVGGV